MSDEPIGGLGAPVAWTALDLRPVGVGRIDEDLKPARPDPRDSDPGELCSIVEGSSSRPGGCAGLAASDVPDTELIDACLAEVAASARGEGFLVWWRLMMVCGLLDVVIGGYSDAELSRESLRVLEPYAQVAARLSMVLSIGRCAAETLIDRAEAARDRIPRCGRLLRDGVISVAAFGRLVVETAAVTDPEMLARIDADAAAELAGAGAVSVSRAVGIMRSVVRAVDPDAVRRERERAQASRDVQVWPAQGDMATLGIVGSAEEVVLAEKAIATVAQSVCEDDPRTAGRRRSDAALARLRGEVFGCACGREECPARVSEEEIAERFSTIVVHVVANGSTLEGGDEPGHLEGHGAIDADLVREIASRPGTLVRPLDYAALRHPAQAADPYRPTAACEVFMRTVFPSCTWPGCSRPAWRCQLDHVCEFDHDRPDAGGPTCHCNLNPKCTFHHLLKTFGEGWVDDQIIDANGVIWTEVTTPEGFTVRSKALNTWLLPDLGLVPCAHPPTVAPGAMAPAREPMRVATRTQRKHEYRMRLRARNRRAAEKFGGTRSAAADFDDDLPPPF